MKPLKNSRIYTQNHGRTVELHLNHPVVSVLLTKTPPTKTNDKIFETFLNQHETTLSLQQTNPLVILPPRFLRVAPWVAFSLPIASKDELQQDVPLMPTNPYEKLPKVPGSFWQAGGFGEIEGAGKYLFPSKMLFSFLVSLFFLVVGAFV